MIDQDVQKRRYVIFALPMARSHGVRVLYDLYRKIKQRGYPCVLFCPQEHLEGYDYIDSFSKETLANDLVIYPEVVYGNPLRFQHVIRFVLYYPGIRGGEKTFYHDELVFTWSTSYCKGHWLGWPSIDYSLFFDEHLPKVQNCYFINKRGLWKELHEIKNAVEINMSYPETKEELAHLLKTTEILYSFDDESLIHEEAALCGARVLIVTENGFKEYKAQKNTGNFDLQTTNKLFDNFITMTQSMKCSGPLQPDEPFYRLFVDGLYYPAALRCIICGAWKEALTHCLRAYEGDPERYSSYTLDVEPELIDIIKQLSVQYRYDEVRLIVNKRINAIIARKGERKILSSLYVLLSHFCERSGNDRNAEEAIAQALQTDPFNIVAVRLQMERWLRQKKLHKALNLFVNVIVATFLDNDEARVLQLLALLGYVASMHKDHLPILAERLSSLYAECMRE